MELADVFLAVQLDCFLIWIECEYLLSIENLIATLKFEKVLDELSLGFSILSRSAALMMVYTGELE